MRLLTALLLAFTTHIAAAAEPALSRYAGRVVYLDFWASWCGPCAESFPWLNAMQAKYGPSLAIVGVNVDTDAHAADTFLQKHPARFDIVRDPQGALPEQYQIEGMPTSLILDGQGRVIHRHTGFHAGDSAAYESAIREALGSAQGARR